MEVSVHSVHIFKTSLSDSSATQRGDCVCKHKTLHTNKIIHIKKSNIVFAYPGFIVLDLTFKIQFTFIYLIFAYDIKLRFDLLFTHVCISL